MLWIRVSVTTDTLQGDAHGCCIMSNPARELRRGSCRAVDKVHEIGKAEVIGLVPAARHAGDRRIAAAAGEQHPGGDARLHGAVALAADGHVRMVAGHIPGQGRRVDGDGVDVGAHLRARRPQSLREQVGGR